MRKFNSKGRSKKNISKQKKSTKSKKKNIKSKKSIKKKTIPKKKTTETTPTQETPPVSNTKKDDINDLFSDTNLNTNLFEYNDVSKDGIIEYLKNKLLNNILNTRYIYMSWFNRFNRTYQLIDFLTAYINAFLQLNNYTINEIYLYSKDNNIRSFSDFSDHIYIKNKIILLREKLINSLDKFIIKGTPPIYYTDLDTIINPLKNIYILDNTNIKKDILKEVDDKIKNAMPTIPPPPPPPAAPPAPPAPPAPVPYVIIDDIAPPPPAPVPYVIIDDIAPPPPPPPYDDDDGPVINQPQETNEPPFGLG